jgi:hypothetical protein
MVIFRLGNLRFEDVLVPFVGVGRKLEPFALFRALVVVGWGEDSDELGENFGACLALIRFALPSRQPTRIILHGFSHSFPWLARWCPLS